MNCPECGKDYEKLGYHLSQGGCEFPEVDDSKRQILSGLLMGDGYIKESKYNSFIVGMCNREFLNWLDKRLGWLSCGVTKIRTAKKSAENNRKSGIRPEAKEKNYSDVYRLTTFSHPLFNVMRNEWYTPSGKKFNMDRVTLSPEQLKMWYVSDGGFMDREKRRPYSYFRLDSQSELAKIISERLEELGIENNVRDRGNVIAVTTTDTPKMLTYMGEPVPGFEYKWGR